MVPSYPQKPDRFPGFSGKPAQMNDSTPAISVSVNLKSKSTKHHQFEACMSSFVKSSAKLSAECAAVPSAAFDRTVLSSQLPYPQELVGGEIDGCLKTGAPFDS